VTSSGVDRSDPAWAALRFRYLADVRKGRLPSQQGPTSEGLPLVPYLSMDYLRGEVDEPTLIPVEDGLLLADTGDLLLLWDGSNAGEFMRAKAGVVSSTAALVVPKNVNPSFFYWACKAQETVLRTETVGMGIPHVSGESLANLRVPLPPPDCQRAIAGYLDREMARLDAMVAAKERALGLLAEKRRALITRAVTRGLDPRAPLRDSGIPWLGEIPMHWEIWTLGHVALVGNGSTPNRDSPKYWLEGSVPWVNSSVVNQEEVIAADQFVTATALHECHLPLVRPGSVLVGITGQGKTRGQAVVLSFEATVNQHIAFITPCTDRLDAWFLRWALFAAYEFLRSISDDAGGTKGALTCEDLATLRVPLPPIAQQRAIVEQVAKETAKLDAVRSATERTIVLLKERRAALIVAAVTGKVRVREVIA